MSKKKFLYSNDKGQLKLKLKDDRFCLEFIDRYKPINRVLTEYIVILLEV